MDEKIKSFKSKQIINYLIKEKEKLKIDIFQTPFSQSDDIYIIISSLNFNVRVLTNDKFGNHIDILKSNFKKNSVYKQQIEFFIKDRIVNYRIKWDSTIFKTVNNNFFEIIGLKHFSKCIQIIDNEIYIPDQNYNFYKVIH